MTSTVCYLCKWKQISLLERSRVHWAKTQDAHKCNLETLTFECDRGSWKEGQKEKKKKTNEHQTFHATHFSMLMVVICQWSLGAFGIAANVHAQYAQRTLLLPFQSVWAIWLVSPTLLTAPSYFTSFTSSGDRQNNTRLRAHRRTQNKSSKRCSYLLLMDRFTCSVLCSECRDKAGGGGCQDKSQEWRCWECHCLLPSNILFGTTIILIFITIMKCFTVIKVNQPKARRHKAALDVIL